MLGEDALIESEDAVDRLGPVGDQAEGHRQDGAVGHQATHHLVMGGEPASLGSDLLVGEVADDRRDPIVAQRVDLAAIDPGEPQGSPIGTPVDDRIEIAPAGGRDGGLGCVSDVHHDRVPFNR